MDGEVFQDSHGTWSFRLQLPGGRHETRGGYHDPDEAEMAMDSIARDHGYTLRIGLEIG
jgi:hypothetical protein